MENAIDDNEFFAKHLNFNFCSSCISSLLFIHDEFRRTSYQKGQEVLEDALIKIFANLIVGEEGEDSAECALPNTESFFRSYVRLSKDERKHVFSGLANNNH